jgi:diguanylate cyclase (GGDEF)-like protein
MLVLEGALLLIGTFAPFRWRTAILRRRNEQLEAMVHERTKALEVANAALEEASLVDPLTGLHNRRYLMATMPEEEARFRRTVQDYLDRGESPLGRNEDLILVMVDLDHFKQVNDAYGHPAGDQVLAQTAKALRSVTRDSDSLVRWGGEEFLLVAKRTDRSRGNLIAENLCTAIREQVYTLPEGRTIRMTASLGYAAFPFLEHHPEAFTWEDTLQVADQCLYSAKHSGRNGWVGVHSPGPADPEDLGTRIRADLGGLVREGLLVLRSSF